MSDRECSHAHLSATHSEHGHACDACCEEVLDPECCDECLVALRTAERDVAREDLNDARDQLEQTTASHNDVCAERDRLAAELAEVRAVLVPGGPAERAIADYLHADAPGERDWADRMSRRIMYRVRAAPSTHPAPGGADRFPPLDTSTALVDQWTREAAKLLSPCPHCGGAMEVLWWQGMASGGPSTVALKCRGCLFMSAYWNRDSWSKMVVAWNRRYVQSTGGAVGADDIRFSVKPDPATGEPLYTRMAAAPPAGCDMAVGPCSCGATHSPGDPNWRAAAPPTVEPPGLVIPDCLECMDKGGHWDDDAIDQWYPCEACKCGPPTATPGEPGEER